MLTRVCLVAAVVLAAVLAQNEGFHRVVYVMRHCVRSTIDDLLDESATVDELGKDIGSDKAKGKMTWQAVHGTEAAREKATALTDAACAAADSLPNGKRLRLLAEEMLRRKF